jgi:formylmethanofuran dehydrogenase subunit B
MLCDDLEIASDGTVLKVNKNGCAKAKAGFEAATPAANPRIAGRDCSSAEAQRAVAEILKKANHPHLGGLGTDVNGMRACLALADRCGGVVDHNAGDGLQRNVNVLQQRGYFLTTLTEVRNRADLLILVGTDPGTTFPRFFERIVWTAHTLDEETAKHRAVYAIGPTTPTGAEAADGRKPTWLDCPKANLPEVVGVLRCLLNGTRVEAQDICGIPIAALRALAERIKAARFVTFVWAPPELDIPGADLAITAITDILRDLNRTTRASGLVMGGSDGGLTALNVTCWQTGYPLRVSFAKGWPEYSPDLFSCRRLLAAKAVDALLWIWSFPSAIKPPAHDLPHVVLGLPGMALDREPEVFIPVGTPGRDHEGRIIRADSVVTLRVRQVRDAGLPSVATVVGGIEAEYVKITQGVG